MIFSKISKIPFIAGFFHFLKFRKFKKNWRKLNAHNATHVTTYFFPLKNVSVGNMSYGPIEVQSLWEQENEKLEIGNHVSIAPGVVFLMGVNHQTQTFSTFPYYSRFVEPSPFDGQTKGPIILEDDVWIGTNAIILSNVTIGKGAIVAAGSVVTRSVEPFAIVGGNPAKIIKYRFTSDIVEVLKPLDLNKLSKEVIVENIDFLYKKIESVEDAKKVAQLINENSKKDA